MARSINRDGPHADRDHRHLYRKRLSLVLLMKRAKVEKVLSPLPPSHKGRGDDGKPVAGQQVISIIKGDRHDRSIS